MECLNLAVDDVYLAILIVVFIKAVGRTYVSPSLFEILYNLPGVILHELSHYIVSLLLGGKPSGFTVIPRKVYIDGKKYWILGSVKSYINPFNAFFIGTAPLLILVPLSYLIYQKWFLFFEKSVLSKIALYTTIYIILYNSIPSKQDLKVAFKYKSGIGLLILALIGIVLIVK